MADTTLLTPRKRKLATRNTEEQELLALLLEKGVISIKEKCALILQEKKTVPEVKGSDACL